MAKSKGSMSAKDSKSRVSTPQRGPSQKERPESGSSRNKAAVDGKIVKGSGRVSKDGLKTQMSKKDTSSADSKTSKTAKLPKDVSFRSGSKSGKERKIVELEKHRHLRRIFLDYKSGISTSDHRKAFCEDLNHHIKTIAHYRKQLAKETLERLELRVFGAPLKDITDAAEKRLIDRIRQLQQAGVTTALTGAVEAPTKATISEAAAYFRLRETLLILDKMMAWQHRILRWLRETHLGYAKHVIRELPQEFYRLEQTLAVFPLIWDPTIGTRHHRRTSVKSATISQPPHRKSGGASRRASNSSLYGTADGPGYRYGHRHDSTYSRGHSRHRSRYCEDGQFYSYEYQHSDIYACVNRKRRSTSRCDPYIYHSSVDCSRRAGGEDKQKRQAPSKIQDPEALSMGHPSAKGKGETHETPVIEQKHPSPHIKKKLSHDLTASIPEQEMRLIEGRIQYFQRAVSYLLDDVGRLIERLKDPAKVWHRDSQYMNAFSIKMQCLKQSLPEAYLLEPINELKQQLEYLIPLA